MHGKKTLIAIGVHLLYHRGGSSVNHHMAGTVTPTVVQLT
jgi:hypothetical protein